MFCVTIVGIPVAVRSMERTSGYGIVVDATGATTIIVVGSTMNRGTVLTVGTSTTQTSIRLHQVVSAFRGSNSSS